MLAMASASVVPAIERWGVLVTNLAATGILILGALCVFDPHLLLFPPRRPEYADVRIFGSARSAY